jgi:hypothetical protein
VSRKDNRFNQGCQINLGARYQKCKNVPNQQKVYQMVIQYPKCPQNIPNGHKKYTHFPIYGPPKFTQIGIFGLKKKPSGNPGFNIFQMISLESYGLAGFEPTVHVVSVAFLVKDRPTYIFVAGKTEQGIGFFRRRCDKARTLPVFEASKSFWLLPVAKIFLERHHRSTQKNIYIVSHGLKVHMYISTYICMYVGRWMTVTPFQGRSAKYCHAAHHCCFHRHAV